MKYTDNHKEPQLRVEGVSEEELKRNVFKTPTGYFDNLTPRILANARDSEAAIEPSWPVWMKVLTPTIGVAAIALTVWFFTPPTENESPDFETVLASLSVEELTLYANADPTELVKYELVDYTKLNMNEMSEEELLEYLELEEEIEMNTLINEIEI